MEVVPKEIRLFRSKLGHRPYMEWFQSIEDQRTRQIIQVRIDRLSLGNPGLTNSVGEGVQELKISYGPGFRVYFGSEGSTVVVLLLGGDKSSQNDDIKKAKAYWKEYKEEKQNAD